MSTRVEKQGAVARWHIWVYLVLALLMSVSLVRGAQPGQATSSRAAREDAIRSIPLDKLDRETQAKARNVISHTSVFRRMPTQVTDCDPDMYLFLVRHPEVVVDIWEVMGISQCKLTRTGKNSFSASDGAGSSGVVKILYSSHDTQVIYADGAYEGPMFERPVKARCLLVLKSAFMREPNERYYVTSRMDAFIQIDHVGLELLAKTFQPLVIQSADYNFSETSAFLGNISRTAETNPAGLGRLSAKLKHVDAETREKFTELAQTVADKPTPKRVAQSPTPARKKK